ncbi:hypothetical protein EUX98_g3722 [Antrodiella citrinella]|uniref:C2H2-type domain-containing protein n=1 Tax=Antrodiella citrinella TaxID=2447956 RepID=A0A4S4MVT8_9APHY|nr:hypothetical protein EUX98_g3722 [Antrodiella citrinella]
MDTLVANPHHYTMNPVAYNHPGHSSRPSPHTSIDFYPDHQLLAQSFSQSGPSSLSISTAHSTPHHEPEEETAHPLRTAPQPPVVPVQHLSEDFSGDGSSSDSHPRPPSSQGSLHGSSDSFADAFPGLSRPLTHQERELLAHLDRLKFFLATAPSRWSADGTGLASNDPSALPLGHPNSAHPALNRFLLPNSEYVSCILWGGLYHITGTDIVRALVFRFEAFGRPVKNMKKFEEGVFSDLRNLKPGVDACLEEPKSPFLDLLFKYQCIRTQKKQKVFYWFSVPHDRLFLDALERDLKREKMGLEPTTMVVGEPAASFTYDPKRSLYDQFSKAQGGVEGESELEAAVRRADEAMSDNEDGDDPKDKASSDKHHSDAEASSSEADEHYSSTNEDGKRKKPLALNGPNSAFFSMFSLFEGSPTYKQRRKKVPKSRRSPSAVASHLRDSPDDFGGMYGMRMAEPQIDRYGRDTTRMSAADMFLAQARGDFGPQSNPDLVATQKERQRRAMQVSASVHGGPSPTASYMSSLTGPGVSARSSGLQYPPAPLHPASVMMPEGGISLPNGYHHHMPPHRVHADQRHNTYPLMAFNQPTRSNTQPAFDPHAGWPTTAEPMSTLPATKTKAFVCPLFSCGRMFARAEHLKRHLRTHTLERPYQCTKCRKRFSRSDNLNQHFRTHLRGDGEHADDEGGAESGSEEQQLEGELEGEEDAFGAMGYGNMPDMQMCEVEIQGQVHEVQGDEEGLVVPQGPVSQPHVAHPIDEHDDVQDVFFPDASVVAAPDSSFVHETSPGVQWATLRAQPSPVFSTTSMPSPQPRMTPSSSYGSSHLSDYMTSVSAPSHKAAFDHGALYPPELNGLASGGPGPIRRHRSATPSVGRYPDGARRSYTAAIPDSSASSRSYHPYAVSAAVSQSAESSPMHYNVPLEAYDQHHHHHQAQHMMRASPHQHHSRSSSAGQQLQDQMQQMLHMEAMDPADAFTSSLYRTESPMQFGGVGVGYSQAEEVPRAGDVYAGMGIPGEFVGADASAAFYSTMAHGAHPVTM